MLCLSKCNIFIFDVKQVQIDPDPQNKIPQFGAREHEGWRSSVEEPDDDDNGRRSIFMRCVNKKVPPVRIHMLNWFVYESQTFQLARSEAERREALERSKNSVSLRGPVFSQSNFEPFPSLSGCP